MKKKTKRVKAVKAKTNDGAVEFFEKVLRCYLINMYPFLQSLELVRVMVDDLANLFTEQGVLMRKGEVVVVKKNDSTLEVTCDVATRTNPHYTICIMIKKA